MRHEGSGWDRSFFIVKECTNKDGVFKSEVVEWFNRDPELDKYQDWTSYSKVKCFKALADSLGYEINAGQPRRQRKNPKTEVMEDTFVLSKPTPTACNTSTYALKKDARALTQKG